MHSRRGAVVILALLAFGALVCHSQSDEADDFGGDNFDLDMESYGYGEDMDEYLNDEAGYYGDDDNNFYDYHGYYTEEYDGGYSGYDEEDYDEYKDCTFDDKGKAVLRNITTACPIKIAGVDKHAGSLPGGVDGLYDVVSCYNGKPLYRRRNTSDSEASESRVLWYSDSFGDWDVSRGEHPREEDTMLYGGEREFAALPLLVSKWYLHSADKRVGTRDYKAIKVQVTCADGTKLKKEEIEALQRLAQERRSTGPMLTNDEFDKKYKEVYEKFGSRPDPNPAVSFTFVVLLVMIGLTIVLAIPFFLVKKKSNGKASISTSFSQMLQQSKKKQSGHAN